MIVLRRAVALGAALALGPALVTAQECKIDLSKPGQVKDANNALGKTALFAGKTPQVLAAVKEAVTKLEKDRDKVIAANPAGRALVLGNIYSTAVAAYFADTVGAPDFTQPVTRGSLGFTTNPEAMIDLIAATDSAYDIVEAADAACKDETEDGRRKVYAGLVNNAVNAYNAQNIDEAQALAERGLEVYGGFKLAYIAHNLRGNALQAKTDYAGAVEEFKKMAELMKGDTSLVEERQQQMTSISQLILVQAEQAEGDAQQAKVQEAITFLNAYLKEFPDDAKAESALARAQIMTGDEEAAARVFGAMAANPAKYSDQQLFEAAVNAARANKDADAKALFKAGLTKNEYSRDGLFNLSLTLQKLEEWNDAETYLRKLVSVDPENPEVYQVFALNYQGLAKAAKAAAEKKPDTDPAVKHYRMINDSLLHYFNKYQNATTRVSFSLWSHDGDKHTLAGSVENMGEAEKPYTLKFEFLDAKGAVVASKEAVVGAVGAKASKAFRVEVDGAGVLAFRYAPIS